MRSALFAALVTAAALAACADASPESASTPLDAPSAAGDATVRLHDERVPLLGPVGGDGSYVDAPFAKLSDYGLLTLDAGHIAFARGVLAYDVRNPLFTDYATKARGIYVPPGQRARYDATRPFDLPVGSIVVKSFGYAGRWIETRLLVRARDGLKGYAYLWDDAQRDAVLSPGGAVVETSTGATHLVPSQNQCPKCHGDGTAMAPIGLRAEQLDRDVSFGGAPEDQLARWAKAGILEGVPAPAQRAPRVAAYADPSSGDVSARARAYLDSNCAHCHNAAGSARTTGLFLGWRVTDPYTFGVCKSPVAAGRATGGLRFDVVPGAPDESILVRRLRSTEPSVMMPELGRSLVHEEAVALVAAWIGGLGGQCQTP